MNISRIDDAFALAGKRDYIKRIDNIEVAQS